MPAGEKLADPKVKQDSENQESRKRAEEIVRFNYFYN